MRQIRNAVFLFDGLKNILLVYSGPYFGFTVLEDPPARAHFLQQYCKPQQPSMYPKLNHTTTDGGESGAEAGRVPWDDDGHR